MSYLVGSETQSGAAGMRFRALLGRDGILQLPGAHNGLASLQARAAGFRARFIFPARR